MMTPSGRRSRANRAYKDSVIRPACEVCGYNYDLTVHHMKQACDGGSESPANKILLCRNHHGIADRLSREDKRIWSRKRMVHLIRTWERSAGQGQGVA